MEDLDERSDREEETILISLLKALYFDTFLIGCRLAACRID